MSQVKLAVQARDIFGKKLKALRKQGLIPANLVSKGKSSQALLVDDAALTKVLNRVGYTQALELNLDKESVTVLVTRVDYVVTTNKLEHVVFQEVKRGERITTNVPIKLVGDAPGVAKGLNLLQMMYDLEVTAPALRIPDSLEVDVGQLEEDGDAVRVHQVDLPEDVETAIDENAPVVRLEISRAQISEESGEDEETAEASDEGESEDDQEKAEDGDQDGEDA